MTDPADDFVKDIVDVCERHGMKILPALPPHLRLELFRDRWGARRGMEDALRIALDLYKAKG